MVYVCWEPHSSINYVNNWVIDINQIMILIRFCCWGKPKIILGMLVTKVTSTTDFHNMERERKKKDFSKYMFQRQDRKYLVVVVSKLQNCPFMVNYPFKLRLLLLLVIMATTFFVMKGWYLAHSYLQNCLGWCVLLGCFLNVLFQISPQHLNQIQLRALTTWPF